MLNSLGITYTLKANYAEAMKCHFESLSVMEKLDNKQWIGTSLINIGLVYYKIEDYDKALEYFKRAYQFKKDINHYVDMDMLLIDIGLCYNSLKRYKEAEDHIELALDVCKTNCSDYIILQAEYALGIIAFEQDKMMVAENHFLRSYSLAKETSNKRLQFDNAINLSKIYQRSSQFKKAERCLIEVEKLVTETSYDLEIIKLYKQFFLLYAKMDNQKKAALYQKKYIQLKDSVYHEDYTNRLMSVQSEYLERKNNARLATQQQKLELKDKIIVRQNWLNILAGITAMLLFLVVYLLYRRNEQRRIANQLLGQRVAARTSELESSYSQLRNRLAENELTHKKTIADVKSIVATMKGLSSGSIDSDSLKQMEMLEITLDRLVETLKNFSEPSVITSEI